MAYSEHRKLQIRQSDTVIISATPIPGNEKSISRVIDQLYRCGANVIYKALAEVHVSGHACQEELKLMHALVKPKYFIPVHGEYRMLWQHAVLAESMGMNSTDIVLPETGQVIEMNQEGLYWRNRFRPARCWWMVWASATWATSFCATASTSVRMA